MNKLFSAAVVIITLTSCAVHNGYINNSTSLSQANFNYEKFNISGKSQAVYFLGIGGLSRNALVQEAKSEMILKNPLQANQALANVTVNWKSTYFIVTVVKCTVTADIVQFHSDYNTESIGVNETENIDTLENGADNKDLNSVKSTGKFHVGETVIFKDAFNNLEATILNYEYPYYEIKYLSKGGEVKTKRVTDEWLHKVNK